MLSKEAKKPEKKRGLEPSKNEKFMSWEEEHLIEERWERGKGEGNRFFKCMPSGTKEAAVQSGMNASCSLFRQQSYHLYEMNNSGILQKV